MSFFMLELLLFLIKVIIILGAIVIVLKLIFKSKDMLAKDSPFKLVSLNEYYTEMKDQFEDETLDKKALKAKYKARKKHKHDETQKPRLFVLDFKGDVEASGTEEMADQVSAILQVAAPNDRVLLRLESGGGYVHSYGLAASQLARFKQKHIPLCIAVDKVAASGGYMMACVADEIVAAPFAIIGSVGVVAAVPNVNKVLKKYDVDYELHTAGEYKRTLTVFGENTEEGRQKFCQELEDTHTLFKNHIRRMRPQLDLEIEQLATGETWYGQVAVDKKLVDRIATSDDLILESLEQYQVIHLAHEEHISMLDRLRKNIFGSVQVQRPFKQWIQ